MRFSVIRLCVEQPVIICRSSQMMIASATVQHCRLSPLHSKDSGLVL